MTHGNFADARVVPDSYIAYADDTTYTISFTPEHIIKQNGYIDVQFPPEVAIPDKSYSQSSCEALEGTGFPTTQITCEFLDQDDEEDSIDSTGHYTLRIMYAFRREDGEAMREY